MDNEKIKQLKERRLLLQERVRLKGLRDRIAFQLDYLDQQNFPYEVYYNHEHLNWIRANVQVRKRDGYNGIHDDFQIDVEDVAQNGDEVYHQKDLLSDKFKKQILFFIAEDELLVVCCEGGDPEIEISVEAFLSQPLKFFSKLETWIITKGKTWIIECIWGQEEIRFIQLHKTNPILIKRIKIRSQ